MILILLVGAFSAFILYKLLGTSFYWIAALVAVIYLTWFRKTDDQIKLGSNTVEKFMNADVHLQQLMSSIDYIQHKDKWLHAQLITDISDFYNLYLQTFTEGTQTFDLLVDKRRAILNELSQEISESVVNGFSECLWKYIKVIVTKYDLTYMYPIPHNTMGKNDLY